MGRRKKYSPAALERAVEAYFDSISRPALKMEVYDSGQKDDMGHTIWAERPVLNGRGEQVQYRKYLLPPTLGGLCEALEISRETWSNYAGDAKYLDAISRARGLVRAYLESELLTREGKDLRGVIFTLQANFGMSETTTVELGARTRKAMAAEGMSLAQRRALLQEIAAEYGARGPGEREEDGDENFG